MSSEQTAVAPPEKKEARKPAASEVKSRRQPPYNIVLLNDDDQSFEYVIEMLRKLFGHDETRGFLLAMEVHTTGRVIVDTTTKERAELKRDQIHAYGADRRIERCKGSMSAIIEPATV